MTNGFIRLPLIDSYLGSLQVFYPVLISGIFKNTKDDFSATYSPCQQRRKSLSTSYSSVHSGIMVSPNSMRVRKCRSHLQANLWFGYSHSYLLQWDMVYLCPTYFIGRILPSYHLSKVWPLILWGCLSPPGVMNQTLRILRHWIKINSPAGYSENISSPHPTSRSHSGTVNPSESTIHLVRKTCWSVLDTLWGFACAICVSVQF